MNAPEEAKFWRDKHVLETIPNANKATAVIVGGVDPDNYDKILGKPVEEEARERVLEAYEDIENVLDYYMDLPEEYKKIIALWIIGTYLHPHFPTFPYLFINAMRGSGKTRLLRIISYLAAHGGGMVSTEPTDSVLFRTPKHHTLVFDEFEGIGGKDKGKFRLYLNASYKVGGVVQRTKKVKKEKEENYEIETFEPYKPIAMANIWGMEEVLEDRCLTLILQKSNNPAKTKKIEDFESNYTIQKIKRTLTQDLVKVVYVDALKDIYIGWNGYIELHHSLHTSTTLTTLTTPKSWIEEVYEKIDETNIDGRNLELIFPILITARMISKYEFEKALKICKDIIGHKKEDELAESKDVCLIDFIANAYDDMGLNFVTLKDMVNHFRAYLNEIEDADNKWLNSKWVSNALRRLDLVADKRRLGRGTEVVLNINKAKEKLKMFKREVKEEQV